MPAILGVNFLGEGGGVKSSRNKAEKLVGEVCWRNLLRKSPAIFLRVARLK